MDYKKYRKVSNTKIDRFTCKNCDYSTSYNSNWKKHILTKKHHDYKMTTKSIEKYRKVSTNITESSPTLFECVCGKIYSNRQNLHRHKKNTNCDKKSRSREELLLEENKHLINQIIKVNDTLIEGINGNHHNLINNNSFNTTNINVQLFLSEQCKDAMSIQDYAHQLILTMEDIANTNINRSEGITDIIFKNLTPLKLTNRPVHCTLEDKWYIKDNQDGWSEDTNKERLVSETYKGMQRKVQSIFEKQYPEWKTDDKLGEKYVETIGTVMGNISARDVKRVRDAAKEVCSIDCKK